MGVPIRLDTVCLESDNKIEDEVFVERNLIFNLNVIQKCVDRFGEMDNILNSVDIETVKWIAVQMVNEDAAIWNKKHPDRPKTLLTEEDIGMYVIGMHGLLELQNKVRDAMLIGLGPEQVQEVEEIEKNLTTAQVPSGKTASLLKRFLKK